MENQDKFGSYADVNKEIQALLASKQNTPHIETAPRRTEGEDVLTLLETLSRTYGEINAALRTGDSQALKDVVLKSDIKMSMVCETLLETLRKTTEEKNRQLREIQDLERTKRELETTGVNNKVLVEKLKSELEFKRINVEELNRVISDQKGRMGEFKEEAVRARSEAQFLKAKMDEIENLRGRASERMGVYEKELEALNAVIKDKDSRIQALAAEKRAEEEKNSGVKTRLTELESLVGVLNKKLELKDKNATLCNSELSKVLCENKRLRVEHEKYKESSEYYEGLYKSLNTQNAYLNTQLNKMLKMDEYSKDVDGSITKFIGKLKKKKRKIKKLKEENERLKNEEPKSPDDSEQLLKRIEDLNGMNEKFRRQISELEKEKGQLETRVKSLRIDDDAGFKEKVKNILSNNTAPARPAGSEVARGLNFKTYKPIKHDDGGWKPAGDVWKPAEAVQKEGTWEPHTYAPATSKPGYLKLFDGKEEYGRDSKDAYGKDNKDAYGKDNKDAYGKDNKDAYGKDNKDTYGLDAYKKDAYGNNGNAYPAYKEANAYTSYKEANPYPIYNKEADPYPIYSKEANPYPIYSNKNIADYKPNAYKDAVDEYAGYRPDYNLNADYNDYIPKNDQGGFVGGLVNDSDIAQPTHDYKEVGELMNKESVHMNSLDKLFKERIEDNASVESVKTYHTSSTLKEMMAKTESLKKKFDDLENKLAQISEGESIDKLTDKIKTCNSYYSEWNADSNESDYI